MVDGRTKGIPPGMAPFPLADVGGMGWNVLREDMTLPLAVLKLPALDHNSRWMAEFLKATGTALAPHGKTTMSPALFERQLADGAWGMTLATVQQVRVARANGIGRIVLANQLVGRQAIDYIAAEWPAIRLRLLLPRRFDRRRPPACPATSGSQPARPAASGHGGNRGDGRPDRLPHR